MVIDVISLNVYEEIGIIILKGERVKSRGLSEMGRDIRQLKR
jgi:hypothetical protein